MERLIAIDGNTLHLLCDGRVDVADIKALTRADAQRIYVEHYFRRPRLAELPVSVQASVFDMYVNAGTNAIKILQRLVTRMGFPASDDGMIGPATIRAALPNRRFRGCSAWYWCFR